MNKTKLESLSLYKDAGNYYLKAVYIREDNHI